MPLLEETIDGFSRYEHGTPFLLVQSYSPQAARQAYRAALTVGHHGTDADGICGERIVVRRSNARGARNFGHECCMVRMRRT